MAEALKDFQFALDAVADQLAVVPYWLTICGLCAICSTLADDVRDRYLLHFLVRRIGSMRVLPRPVCLHLFFILFVGSLKGGPTRLPDCPV